MSEWQPIETAPKDGTPIFVCNRNYTDNGFLPVSVRWRHYHPNSKGEACWRDVSGHKIGFVDFWMPLPAPPKETGNG